MPGGGGPPASLARRLGLAEAQARLLAGRHVALGKFDALHTGHRALAAAASTAGPPALLSFAGMAEVLGWERRLPLTAPADRPRVLARHWAPHCGGRTPAEAALPFAGIRGLGPEEFVELLAELGVRGLVCGANYRFGFRAAGTAADLVAFGEARGLRVAVLDLVADPDVGGAAPVSSSRVRELVGRGEMAGVRRCLGRPYRLLGPAAAAAGGGLALPAGGALNLVPAAGEYRCQVGVAGPGGGEAGAEAGAEARVTIGPDAGVAVELLQGGRAPPPGPGALLAIDFEEDNLG